MPRKTGLKKGRASKPWLPDPNDVIEVKEVRSQGVGSLRILRTNIVDPYDEPLPPAKLPRKQKK